jgi:hypothetical protein
VSKLSVLSFAPGPSLGLLSMRLLITDLHSVYLLGRISQLDAELPTAAPPSRASRAAKIRAAELRNLTAELHERVWDSLVAAGYDPATCTPPVPVIGSTSAGFEAALEWRKA